MTLLRNRLGDAGAAQIICTSAYKEGLNLRELYAAATTARDEAKAAAKAVAASAATAATVVDDEDDVADAVDGAGGGAAASAGAGAAAAAAASSSSSSSSSAPKRVRAPPEGEEGEEGDTGDADDAGAEHDALIDAGVISVSAKGMQLVDVGVGVAAEAAADDGAVEEADPKYGPNIVSTRSKRSAVRA